MVGEETVAELAEKAGLSIDAARAALEEHGGGVERTLEKLIDAGTVRVESLNPKLVSDKLFARAQRREHGREVEHLIKGCALGCMTNVLIWPLRKAFGLYARRWGTDESMAKKGWAVAEREQRKTRTGPRTLEMEPFGTLQFDGYFWEGEVVLKSWAGFQSRGGSYTTRDAAGPSDGRVSLNVDGNKKTPPRPEQIAAFVFLREHEEEIAKAVLAAILKEYPSLRETYVDFAVDEEKMPSIQNAEELKRLIGLGIACFGCGKGRDGVRGF
jgi:hypothetical protein